MLGTYVGGGMFSLMFQEVREFRSMAYSASGTISVPPPVLSDDTAIFYTTLGTQADKAMSALQLVDSLLREMPLKETRLDASSRSVVARAMRASLPKRSFSMRLTSGSGLMLPFP